MNPTVFINNRPQGEIGR